MPKIGLILSCGQLAAERLAGYHPFTLAYLDLLDLFPRGRIGGCDLE
jgi:hypothetical protein